MKNLPIWLLAGVLLSSCSGLKDMAYNDPVYFTRDDIRAERMAELATLRAGFGGANDQFGGDDFSSDYYDPNFVDSQARNFDNISVENFHQRQRFNNNNFGFGAPGCFDCFGSPRTNIMFGMGMGGFGGMGMGMGMGMGWGMGMGMGFNDPWMMRNQMMWGMNPWMMRNPMMWGNPMMMGNPWMASHMMWGDPFFDPWMNPWAMGGWGRPWGMGMGWGHPMMGMGMGWGHPMGMWGMPGMFGEVRRVEYGSRNQGVHTPSRTPRQTTDGTRVGSRTGTPGGTERQAAPSRARQTDYYRAPSNRTVTNTRGGSTERGTAAPTNMRQRNPSTAPAPQRRYAPQRNMSPGMQQRTATPQRNATPQRYSAPARTAPQRQSMPSRTPAMSSPSRGGSMGGGSFSSPSRGGGGGSMSSPSRGGGGRR
ncbi:MAG: hypothetical protein ACXITV_09250 [Luteibaculaceae bacterium]